MHTVTLSVTRPHLQVQHPRQPDLELVEQRVAVRTTVKGDLDYIGAFQQSSQRGAQLYRPKRGGTTQGQHVKQVRRVGISPPTVPAACHTDAATTTARTANATTTTTTTTTPTPRTAGAINAAPTAVLPLPWAQLNAHNSGEGQRPTPAQPHPLAIKGDGGETGQVGHSSLEQLRGIHQNRVHGST